MEQYLKDLLKKIKLNEPTISTILGLLVIVIVIFLIFKYYRSGQTQTNIPTSEELEQLELEPSADNIPANLPENYTVKEGDTLWLIAQNLYQSGYNWIDIAQANNLPNPDYLNVGQEIVLPKVATKQPEIDLSATQVDVQLATQAAMIQNKESKAQAIESSDYVVQEGDHLWQIAVRAYGDGYKWPEIAKNNNLVNPDYLEVGQKLSLPR